MFLFWESVNYAAVLKNQLQLVKYDEVVLAPDSVWRWQVPENTAIIWAEEHCVHPGIQPKHV